MRIDPQDSAVLAALTKQCFTCQRNTILTDWIDLPEHGVSHYPMSVL